MSVNIEPGKAGTTEIMTSESPRELLLKVRDSTVVCTSCKWIGKGGQLECEDTSHDNNNVPGDPHFGIVTANLGCPTCHAIVLNFEFSVLPLKEASAVCEAEDILNKFRDVINGEKTDEQNAD